MLSTSHAQVNDTISLYLSLCPSVRVAPLLRRLQQRLGYDVYLLGECKKPPIKVAAASCSVVPYTGLVTLPSSR